MIETPMVEVGATDTLKIDELFALLEEWNFNPEKLEYSDDELRVTAYYPNEDVVIEGIIGIPNSYPASFPDTYYLILSHDFDRRANSEVRVLWSGTKEGLREMLAAVIPPLKQGYGYEWENFPNHF